MAQSQVIWAVVIAILIGGGLYVFNLIQNKPGEEEGYSDHNAYQRATYSYEVAKVDLPELILGAVLCFLICWGTVSIGDRWAVSDKIDGYHQFLNGSIVETPKSTIPCERDGNCQHEYACDWYWATETYTETETYTGSDGKSHSRSVTKTRRVHKHHDCPYATAEFSYELVATYGFMQEKHDIASHIFADNPQEWRGGHGIPGDVPRGDPDIWRIAKQRIEAHDPLPATSTNTYTNYILGSDQELLKRFSSDIDKFKKLGLLPPHTADWNNGPVDGWTAQKFQAVGGVRVNTGQWNNALMRFNAALGISRQGDMHMVVVRASAVDKVSNSEAYINALMAYWQSPEFGKWSLAKNSIALVVGVSNDGSQVKWVRAKTGMPTGNGVMMASLEGIRKVPFDPETFLGHPKMVKGGYEPTYRSGHGLVEDIVVFNEASQFRRACMDCKDKGDKGSSYVYLKSQVSISHSVKVWEFIISLFFILAVWGALYAFPVVSGVLGLIRGVPAKSNSHPYNPSNRFRRFGDFQ